MCFAIQCCGLDSLPKLASIPKMDLFPNLMHEEDQYQAQINGDETVKYGKNNLIVVCLRQRLNLKS